MESDTQVTVALIGALMVAMEIVKAVVNSYFPFLSPHMRCALTDRRIAKLDEMHFRSQDLKEIVEILRETAQNNALLAQHLKDREEIRIHQDQAVMTILRQIETNLASMNRFVNGGSK